jgi:hypothetical protein
MSNVLLRHRLGQIVFKPMDRTQMHRPTIYMVEIVGEVGFAYTTFQSLIIGPTTTNSHC